MLDHPETVVILKVKGSALRNLADSWFAADIIARQRGTKWKPGNNVGIGKDDTLFSKIDGIVKFENKGRRGKFVSVYIEGSAELA